MVQVTTAVEVDMTEADLLRKKWKDTLAQRLGIRLTFMPFFIRAAVMAVREYPVLNSALEGDEIVIRRNVDFGIAVQSERGLIVPGCQGRAGSGFLGAGAGAGRPDRTGPGGRHGPPICRRCDNHPFQRRRIWVGDLHPGDLLPAERAHLDGAILEKPAVKEGAIVARKLMNLCVSYDHRIMDGATVARFLGRMKNLLEEPMLLAMDERGM